MPTKPEPFDKLYNLYYNFRLTQQSLSLANHYATSPLTRDSCVSSCKDIISNSLKTLEEVKQFFIEELQKVNSI